jgi:hypothetical protein
MRDENDWRPGDKIAQGPAWEGSHFSTCFCCGKPKTWEEHWNAEADGKCDPTVYRVYRVKGNVNRIAIKVGRRRHGFKISPNAKRYIVNPACKNGGYRSTNDPDPKYQTNVQGKFVISGRSSTRGE